MKNNHGMHRHKPGVVGLEGNDDDRNPPICYLVPYTKYMRYMKVVDSEEIIV